MSLLLMVKHLRNQFLISVACPAESMLARRLAEMKVESLHLPEPPSRFSRVGWLVHLLRTSYHIAKITCEDKPILIHANNFYAAAASVLGAFLGRAKLLWHARDLTRAGLAVRFCGVFSKRVIAVSGSVKDELIKHGVRRDKISVVHNGIEVTESEVEAQGDAVTKMCKREIRFANVGQFVGWKKQGLFLEAACQVDEKGGAAEYVLVGDDIFGRDLKYKTELVRQMRSLRIAEKIKFWGWREDMGEVWREIDCLVHTADREPFGRVIIEAMGNMIPVIAVDSCGPGELIENGKTGLLVGADDAGQLSVAMLRIANDREYARKLASAAYKKVISNFSAEKTAGHIKQIYKQILSA